MEGLGQLKNPKPQIMPQIFPSASFRIIIPYYPVIRRRVL
jgi:hypothetical protein